MYTLRPVTVLLVTCAAASTAVAQGSDVPLELWTSPTWPAGVFLDNTTGVSMGDFDGDGWVDFFVIQSGELWRNVNGQDWELGANLLGLMPQAKTRYGSSIADYDADGLPDIAGEPRNDLPEDTCFRMLHNLGGGLNFLEVAGDPSVVDVAICSSNSETIAWGDMDGDRRLDMILPAYSPTPCEGLFGLGNAFLYNLGPIGPGGNTAFTEMAAPAGLMASDGCRPEGAQIVDLDFDGDLDFFTGGTLFRNLSAPGTPFFDHTTVSAGITILSIRDEGLAFVDYDMDGDLDLLITYIDNAIGVRIYQARGDGSYQLQPSSVVEDNQSGIRLGLSYADWDNDGDVDMTTRWMFRKNMTVETGIPSFATATHTIPAGHIHTLTPAWGDLDRDGDLDAVFTNPKDDGWIYENTLYDAQTPAWERRYVRVRPVQDSSAIPGGLDTEFGAVADITVIGDPATRRRRMFTSSASGYLNQNEYALHFGLPPDPAPANPLIDLMFDVSVDFPSTTDVGIVRVDKLVNPVLGMLRLAQLDDREIRVFRSGKVILDGTVFDPAPAQPTVLTTINEGLQTPSPSTPVDPLSPGSADQFVGVEFDTMAATEPVRIAEVILEGQVSPSIACGSETGNIFLWDVSTPASPALVHAFQASTATTNDRSYIPVNALLEPGRTYRLVAAVTELRSTPSVQVPGPIQVSGGLIFIDADPCTGAAVEAAAVSPSSVGIAFRYHPVAGGAFVDLGHGLAGAAGVPSLSGTGTAKAGTPITLSLAGAAPSSPCGIIIGNAVNPFELFGGTLVPALDHVFTEFGTNSLGEVDLLANWPSALAPGQSLFFQIGVFDLGAPQSIAMSNALAVTTQP